MELSKIGITNQSSPEPYSLNMCETSDQLAVCRNLVVLIQKNFPNAIYYYTTTNNLKGFAL